MFRNQLIISQNYFKQIRSNYSVLTVILLLLAIPVLNACSSASDFTPTTSSNNPETIATSPTNPKIITNSNELIPAKTPNTTPSTIASTPLPSQSQAATSATGLATTGCSQTARLSPGTSINETIAVNPQGARGSPSRTYLLHLSAKYKSNEPQAVLLVFHGHGGNAADMEASTGFSSLADQQNFSVVYPQGIKDDDGLPMWASVGPAADYGIDDLTFTNDLLNKLQTELCINPNRIYATGFSNGGGMSHYLACKLAWRIAAVAPIAGNYFPLPGGGCQPSRAVSLLEIHGTADNVIAYNGRPDKDYPGWPLPAIPDYLSEWASRNGCSQRPQTFLDTKEVKGEEWSGCRDNSGVAHYQIKGGGHSYPASIGGHPSREVIWSFLSRYVLHP